MVTSNCLKYSA